MNPTLARIYGTGMSKTASAGGIDLSQISAADYLEFLNGQEKVANDDGEIDLSQLSAQELIDLVAELENEDPIEKMASSGELSYWDAAGRVMAHAYADEMSKVAGSGEIDLSAISAEDLLAAIDSGEFELVEKTASSVSAFEDAYKAMAPRAPKGLMDRLGGYIISKSDRLAGMQEQAGVRAGSAAADAAVGKAINKALKDKRAAGGKMTRNMSLTDDEMGAVRRDVLRGFDTSKASRKGSEAFRRNLGIGTTVGAGTLGAAGLAGTGYALHRKSKKS